MTHTTLEVPMEKLVSGKDWGGWSTARLTGHRRATDLRLGGPVAFMIPVRAEICSFSADEGRRQQRQRPSSC